MQQGGCCDDALVDGGGVTAAADMPFSELTSRMSKNCGPIVENRLHVGDVLNRWSGTPFTWQLAENQRAPWKSAIFSLGYHQ